MASDANEKNAIKNWAVDDRPREKLINKGSNALSDAELLAILIGSGNKDESAVDLSKRILGYVNYNLVELSGLTVNDFVKNFKGIGKAKAVTIIAALELGKRRRGAEVINRKKISSSKDAYELLQSYFSDSKYEEFWIILLRKNNTIIKTVSVSEGGISATIVDPKKIFKIAIDNNASSIILCHNHPSGNIKPSEADIKLTKNLKAAGSLLEIHVLDHIIISGENYYSFADEQEI
jgi:DNA repair protein RadC